MGFILFILRVFARVNGQFEQMPKADNESEHSAK